MYSRYWRHSLGRSDRYAESPGNALFDARYYFKIKSTSLIFLMPGLSNRMKQTNHKPEPETGSGGGETASKKMKVPDNPHFSNDVIFFGESTYCMRRIYRPNLYMYLQTYTTRAYPLLPFYSLFYFLSFFLSFFPLTKFANPTTDTIEKLLLLTISSSPRVKKSAAQEVRRKSDILERRSK